MPKKRFLMSLILILAAVIVFIISIAVVFAASLQKVGSNLKINYEIDGVGVEIYGGYKTISGDVVSTETSLTNSDGTNKIDISVADDAENLTAVAFDVINATLLDSTTTKIVYKFKIINTAETSYSIGLSNDLNISGVSITYKVSASELDDSELLNDFEETTLMPQALVNIDDTIYVYISATLTATSAKVSSAAFSWAISMADSSEIKTLNLNNGESTGGLSSIKFIYGSNVAMPVVASLPTANDEIYMFDGYFTEADGITL